MHNFLDHRSVVILHEWKVTQKVNFVLDLLMLNFAKDVVVIIFVQGGKVAVSHTSYGSFPWFVIDKS